MNSEVDSKKFLWERIRQELIQGRGAPENVLHVNPISIGCLVGGEVMGIVHSSEGKRIL